MTEQEIFKAIAETVAERTDCNADDVKMESTFHDLGIDSLDTVELLMASLESQLSLTRRSRQSETLFPSSRTRRTNR